MEDSTTEVCEPPLAQRRDLCVGDPFSHRSTQGGGWSGIVFGSQNKVHCKKKLYGMDVLTVPLSNNCREGSVSHKGPQLMSLLAMCDHA